jgi:hypothetical protein
MFIDQTDNIDNIASKFDVMDKNITLYFTKEELTPIPEDNRVAIHLTDEGIKIEKLIDYGKDIKCSE